MSDRPRLSDDDIRRILGDRAPAPVPAARPPVPGVTLAYVPVTINDVRAAYCLALNAMTFLIPTRSAPEGAALIAQAALDTIRMAAAVEACINMRLAQSGGDDSEDGQPYAARG